MYNWTVQWRVSSILFSIEIFWSSRWWWWWCSSWSWIKSFCQISNSWAAARTTTTHGWTMDISFYAIWTLKQRKKPVCKIDFHFNRKPFYGNFSTEIYSYIGTISIKECTSLKNTTKKRKGCRCSWLTKSLESSSSSHLTHYISNVTDKWQDVSQACSSFLSCIF